MTLLLSCSDNANSSTEITDAYSALAYYVRNNGYLRNNEYTILQPYSDGDFEFCNFISTDETASNISFSMIYKTSKFEGWIQMDLDYNSNVQTVHMIVTLKSLDYTEHILSGKIYSNTFSSSNMYLFDYKYEGDFPSQSDKLKTFLTENIDDMLDETKKLLDYYDIGITLPMLGFLNY